MRIGNREFDIGTHTYVMGILNVTPDSFSDGGNYTQTDCAMRRVEEMIGEGVDIIDIGGESTRPGFVPISPEEEMKRVLPILCQIKHNFDIPVSVDTYKAEVARACVENGVDMINDIWGLRDTADVLAKSDIPCVLMHNRAHPVYQDLIRDIMSDWEQCIRKAEEAGVSRERMILDPGIGFGKTYEQNLEVLSHLSELHRAKLPILLGASRKSVIGKTLSLAPTECLEGTLATTVLAVWQGCAFVRVHDIKENVRVIQMTEACKRNNTIDE